jgi:hypothetical protein
MNINDLFEGGQALVIRAIRTQVGFLSGSEMCEVPTGTIVAISEVTKENGKVILVGIEFDVRSGDGVKKLHSISLRNPDEFLSPIKENVDKHLQNPGGEPAFSW